MSPETRIFETEADARAYCAASTAPPDPPVEFIGIFYAGAGSFDGMRWPRGLVASLTRAQVARLADWPPSRVSILTAGDFRYVVLRQGLGPDGIPGIVSAHTVRT